MTDKENCGFRKTINKKPYCISGKECEFKADFYETVRDLDGMISCHLPPCLYFNVLANEEYDGTNAKEICKKESNKQEYHKAIYG